MKNNISKHHVRPQISQELLRWGNIIQTIGVIVLFLMIIVSIIVSVQGSYVYEMSGLIPKKKFDFSVFLGLFAPWIIYYLIEVVVYNFLALVLMGLGELVYYSSITATEVEISERNSSGYERQYNQPQQTPKGPISDAKPQPVNLKSWFCKKCGSYCTSEFYCDTCGAKKE